MNVDSHHEMALADRSKFVSFTELIAFLSLLQPCNAICPLGTDVNGDLIYCSEFFEHSTVHRSPRRVKNLEQRYTMLQKIISFFSWQGIPATWKGGLEPVVNIADTRDREYQVWFGYFHQWVSMLSELDEKTLFQCDEVKRLFEKRLQISPAEYCDYCVYCGSHPNGVYYSNCGHFACRLCHSLRNGCLLCLASGSEPEFCHYTSFGTRMNREFILQGLINIAKDSRKGSFSTSTPTNNPNSKKLQHIRFTTKSYQRKLGPVQFVKYPSDDTFYLNVDPYWTEIGGKINCLKFICGEVPLAQSELSKFLTAPKLPSISVRMLILASFLWATRQTTAKMFASRLLLFEITRVTNLIYVLSINYSRY